MIFWRWWRRKRGKVVLGMWLSSAELSLLLALREGHSLRSHRNLEGEKRYQLHDGGEYEVVMWRVVQRLRQRRLIETNHKFPSAEFLLTERGVAVADAVSVQEHPPLITSARRFVQEE